MPLVSHVFSKIVTSLPVVYAALNLSQPYASVGGARRRHTVVRLRFCLCVCVTLQLAFLKARDKLSADTCNAGTTQQYLKANSLRFLI